MSPQVERRILQASVCVGCLVPLLAGGAGMVKSAGLLHGVHPPLPPDLDSHFRYLSGLLFGLGLVFLWCVPAIERRGTVMRAVGSLAIVGGLARLFGILTGPTPGVAHQAALGMELVAVPVVLLWQARIEKRCAGAANN